MSKFTTQYRVTELKTGDQSVITNLNDWTEVNRLDIKAVRESATPGISTPVGGFIVERMDSAFKTCEFVVHNPSNKKKTQLRTAFNLHHQICRKGLMALKEIESTVEALVCEKDSKGKLKVQGGTLDKFIRANKLIPNNLPVAPLRDHIIIDVVRVVLSYYGRKVSILNSGGDPVKHNLSFPTYVDLDNPIDESEELQNELLSDEEWIPTLEQQDEINNIGDIEASNELRDKFERKFRDKILWKIMRQSEEPNPLPILLDRTRDFTFAIKNKKYYLLINCFGAKHKYSRKQNLEGFTDVFTQKPILKTTGLILPLEFGRSFQLEQYIKQGTPKSIKLLKRIVNGQERFTVKASFEFKPKIIRPETYIGIDRGCVKIGVACLIDTKGEVVDYLRLDGTFEKKRAERYRQEVGDLQKQGSKKVKKVHRKRKHIKDLYLHVFTNEIIEKAKAHKAQLVLEKLNVKAIQKYSFYHLSDSQFRKLESQVKYKGDVAGLYSPLEIVAAYTSMTCPECGCCDKLNRPIQHIFKCVECGHSANADENAARIIALKGLTRRIHKIFKHTDFCQWLKNRGDERLNASTGSNPVVLRASEFAMAGVA